MTPERLAEIERIAVEDRDFGPIHLLAKELIAEVRRLQRIEQVARQVRNCTGGNFSIQPLDVPDEYWDELEMAIDGE